MKHNFDSDRVLTVRQLVLCYNTDKFYYFLKAKKISLAELAMKARLK